MTDLRRDAGFEAEFDVDGCITEIAARMNERLTELASNVVLYIEDAIPEMRGDALSTELFRASAEGNINTVLRAPSCHIAVESVEAPNAALEHARRLAQHDVTVNALVRSYRLGQSRVSELVFDTVRMTDLPPTARVAVLERFTATLFQYVDRISQQVIAVYEEEHERWLEGQNSIRAVRVRELLAGKKVIDIDDATVSIRYPLRWHHLAVVIWYPDARADGDELPRLQRFLSELGQAAGTAAKPLFVAENRVTGWGWLPYKAAKADAVKKIRAFAAGRDDSPSIGIGMTATGVDGFRRSHNQAQMARSVAVFGSQQGPTVLAAADPGLSMAALLAGDVGKAREWVADTLGDLAGHNENDARLRETLWVYLRCGQLQAGRRGTHPSLQHGEIPRRSGCCQAWTADRRRSARRRSGATTVPVVRQRRPPTFAVMRNCLWHSSVDDAMSTLSSTLHCEIGACVRRKRTDGDWAPRWRR